MTKLLTAGAIMLGMALPAMAGEEEYFVALDTTINQCRLMSIQPDGTTMKMVETPPTPRWTRRRRQWTNCPNGRASRQRD